MKFPLQHQQPLFSLLSALWQGGRFPHALMFEGIPGSGKRTVARYTAAVLLCRNQAAAPCGECPSCRKLTSGNHPDLITLHPEGKSKTIGVEQVRTIRAAAYVAPHEAACKVFYIPEAHKLRIEAQNALLKIIEEPPETAYFIFTAPGRGNLLETLCSRLTILPLRALSQEERLAVLTELLPSEDTVLLKAQAALCPTVGQAIDSLNDPSTRQRAQDAEAILQAAARRDRYAILKLFAGYEKDREQFLLLLDALRGAVVAQLTSGAAQFVPLHSRQIIAIIDTMAQRASQNVGIALISAAAVNRLVNPAATI